jgi:hypothetical protein
MNSVRSGVAGQPLAAPVPLSLSPAFRRRSVPRSAVVSCALVLLTLLSGCNGYVSPIDLAGSGKGLPLQALSSGPLTDEQLRAIADVSSAVMLAKYPAPGAAPGMAGGGGGRPGPSLAETAKFETQLQPIFLNVAQQYVATADQAKARGIATQPYVESDWRAYNDLLHKDEVPQSEINERVLRLTAMLSSETLRLREALK